MLKCKTRFLKLTILVSLLTIIQPIFANQKEDAEQVTELTGWKKTVYELDQKIDVLQKWQEGYRMTAQQAQFKADRLQFEQTDFIDAKRLWKVAESANQKAQDLQIIIDKLTSKRDGILRQHGQEVPKNNKNSNSDKKKK